MRVPRVYRFARFRVKVIPSRCLHARLRPSHVGNGFLDEVRSYTRLILHGTSPAARRSIAASMSLAPVALLFPMRVSNQIVRPLESIAETQPQLQPALLRLSAIISQYFTLFVERRMSASSSAIMLLNSENTAIGVGKSVTQTAKRSLRARIKALAVNVKPARPGRFKLLAA